MLLRLGAKCKLQLKQKTRPRSAIKNKEGDVKTLEHTFISTGKIAIETYNFMDDK